jgi:hypothetical protein
MQIEFSKEQYALLVTMVYLGNWMINAIRPDNEQEAGYNDLEQYVYSFAAAMGYDKKIAFDPTLKRFAIAGESEEHPAVDRYIGAYNEENFWHELVHQLAERDMVENFSEAALKAMPDAERVEHEDRLIEMYSREFEKNGIANLVIKTSEKSAAST